MKIGRVSSQLADYIETAIMKDAKIQWLLDTETSLAPPDDPAIIFTQNAGEGPQLVRPVFCYNEFESDTWIYYNFCRPIIRELNLDEELLSRIKINMLLPRDVDYMWHTPHVDSTDKHTVLLYYVNDSDGPTYFFEEKYDGTIKNSCTIMQEIEPEKGKYIIFDGNHFHASSQPSNNLRSVINFNFNAD
jgi:hypothetical protein